MKESASGHSVTAVEYYLNHFTNTDIETPEEAQGPEQVQV